LSVDEKKAEREGKPRAFGGGRKKRQQTKSKKKGGKRSAKNKNPEKENKKSTKTVATDEKTWSTKKPRKKAKEFGEPVVKNVNTKRKRG